MKNQIKISLLVILIASAINASAQNDYPVVICSSGLLVGNYIVKDDDGSGTANSEAVVISVDEAKSISALNYIYHDKEHNLRRGKIKTFSMTVYDEGNETGIRGDKEMLSDEMKDVLSRAHAGEKIFFEYITVENRDMEPRKIICLSFIVK